MGLIFIVVVFATLVLYTIFKFFESQKDARLCKKIFLTHSPQTMIFAFDLHGIVLHINILQFLHLIWTHLTAQMLTVVCKPSTIKILYYIYKKTTLTEFDFDILMARHPEIKILKPLFVKKLTLQYLDPLTIEVVKKLKERGYSLYVLSNIWPDSLKEILHRHPQLKELFKDFFIPTPEQNKGKPSAIFYESFQQYVTAKEGPKKIFFIDNEENNLRAARKVNFYAFNYDCLTALQQLLSR